MWMCVAVVPLISFIIIIFFGGGGGGGGGGGWGLLELSINIMCEVQVKNFESHYVPRSLCIFMMSYLWPISCQKFSKSAERKVSGKSKGQTGSRSTSALAPCRPDNSNATLYIDYTDQQSRLTLDELTITLPPPLTLT